MLIKEPTLSTRLEMEVLLGEISTDFIHASDLDVAIMKAFERLGSTTRSSRVYLFLIDAEAGTMSNTHEWCADGVRPEIGNLQNLPLSGFPWWMQKLNNKEIINEPDVSAMPDEAEAERELLLAQDIKSVLVLPVYALNQLKGYVGFDNIVSNRHWSLRRIQLLQLLADILSNVVVRKMNEDKLHNSYSNLRSFFDLNTECVSIISGTGELLAVNRHLCEKLGYTEQELLGKNVLLLYSADMHGQALQIVQEMMEGLRTTCPLPLTGKNGRRFLVETTIVRGTWDGKFAIYGISKDISHQRLEQEKFFRIFHTIPEIITLSDLETGEYIEVNQTFLSKFGYTHDEVVGKNAESLLQFENEQHLFTIRELQKQDILQNFETTVYNRQGEPLHLLINSYIIHIVDTKYNLTIAIDITEEVKSKQELFRAKEKAEESNIAKTAFLAAITHELRTPLNHILGFSALIPHITENSVVREYAENINKSGSSLQQIIEDIFDLSVMYNATLQVHNNEFFVMEIYSELKSQLVELLVLSGKSSDVELVCTIEPAIANRKITTDKSRVLQVMSNILKNAVKYTCKGTIELTLGSEAPGFLTITVRDTGRGITPEALEVIFDIFRQGSETHIRRDGGLGIGLTISQKVAAALGGTIAVASQPGAGSTFTFTVPCRRQTAE